MCIRNNYQYAKNTIPAKTQKQKTISLLFQPFLNNLIKYQVENFPRNFPLFPKTVYRQRNNNDLGNSPTNLYNGSLPKYRLKFTSLYGVDSKFFNSRKQNTKSQEKTILQLWQWLDEY